jgi:hypothetical protein
VPVEEQSRRPLARRDRVAIAVVALAAAAGFAAGTVLAVESGGPSGAGCVEVTFPASLGGETIRRCGSEALSFCSTEGPRNRRIADACRRAGIEPG